MTVVDSDALAQVLGVDVDAVLDQEVEHQYFVGGGRHERATW